MRNTYEIKALLKVCLFWVRRPFAGKQTPNSAFFMDRHDLLNQINFQIFKYAEEHKIDIDEEQAYTLGLIALETIEKNS